MTVSSAVGMENTRFDQEVEALTSIYGGSFRVSKQKQGGVGGDQALVSYFEDESCICSFSIPSGYPETALPILKIGAYYGKIVERLFESEGKGSEILFSVIELIRETRKTSSSGLSNSIADSASSFSAGNGSTKFGAGEDFEEEGTVSSTDTDLIDGAAYIFAAATDAASFYSKKNQSSSSYASRYGSPQSTSTSLSTSYAPPPPPLCIFHGEPISERKSTFAAHFAIVNSMEQVQQFRLEIASDKKVIV